MALGLLKSLRPWFATLVICALVLHAIAGPLVVAAATRDDGRVLTPICAGGKITFILIDLSGNAPAELVDDPTGSPAGDPEVALEIDCPIQSGKAAILANASPIAICPILKVDGGIAFTAIGGITKESCSHPPARGPPFLS